MSKRSTVDLDLREWRLWPHATGAYSLYRGRDEFERDAKGFIVKWVSKEEAHDEAMQRNNALRRDAGRIEKAKRYMRLYKEGKISQDEYEDAIRTAKGIGWKPNN